MNIFRWDNDKNELLKQSRGVCFEQVVLLMEKGEVLDTYPGQKIAVVMIEAYACIVPYVESHEEIFLKTIISGRKATNKYLRAER